VAIFFWVSKLPSVTSDEKIEPSNKANRPLSIIFIAFLLILAAQPLTQATGVAKSYFVYASLAIILYNVIYTSYLQAGKA
jgi:FHS family L-fucose permease-like MFS transporter